MSGRSLRAVVLVPGDAGDALRAALAGCGVAVVAGADDVPGAEAAHAAEPLDLVLVGGADLLAAARSALLADRLWAVALDLPPALELLVAPPPSLVRAASVARWVLTPDETTRGLLDSAVPDAARRSAVLPVTGRPEALAAALGVLLDRTFPDHPALAGRATPLRVVVAGHALHFLEAVLQDWRSQPGIELRVDEVRSFAQHDEAASRELIAWADTIVCEWASPVAAFYSRNKRPGQRLVVRLHRGELDSDWWRGIDAAALDQVVTVSRYYADRTRQVTGWPADRITVIPNYVDRAVLARPKLPGAELALGLVGAVPRRKRLDLALDVVEQLRARDSRFTLFVKTRHAWEVPYVWREEAERAAYEEALHRVRSGRLLADGVVFDAYGGDVGSWLRKIGWVLSTSDDESFHLAPAEGMASGAVPVIRSWPGADTIYDPTWICPSTAAMVDRIAETVAGDGWTRLGRQAEEEAAASFDTAAVLERFAAVLVGDLPPVR